MSVKSSSPETPGSNKQAHHCENINDDQHLKFTDAEQFFRACVDLADLRGCYNFKRNLPNFVVEWVGILLRTLMVSK
jgi:hypothetical protein